MVSRAIFAERLCHETWFWIYIMQKCPILSILDKEVDEHEDF